MGNKYKGFEFLSKTDVNKSCIVFAENKKEAIKMFINLLLDNICIDGRMSYSVTCNIISDYVMSHTKITSGSKFIFNQENIKN